MERFERPLLIAFTIRAYLMGRRSDFFLLVIGHNRHLLFVGGEESDKQYSSATTRYMPTALNLTKKEIARVESFYIEQSPSCQN